MRRNKWLRRGVYFLIFLLVLYGGFCFALFNRRGGMLGGSLDDVDREALMTYVQYRGRAFEPKAAAARLASEDTEAAIDPRGWLVK